MFDIWLICSFQAGQFPKPYSTKMNVTHFLVSNLPLLAFIIVGYLLIAAFATILPKLTHQNNRTHLKSLKLVLFRAPFMDHSRLPCIALKLVLLFFNIFFFLNLNFLGSSISADKVIVPTQDVVDSSSKLIATSKTLVFNDGELDLVKRAPEGSFLKKLSGKKVLVLENARDLIRMKTEGLQEYVIFTNAIIVVFLANRLSRHAKEIGSVVFIKPIDYYERLSVFQIRRGLEVKSKSFINGRIDLSLDFGFLRSLNLKLRAMFMLRIKRSVEIYEMIDDYVESVSRRYSPDIKLDNTKDLFLFFGGFLALVSLFFVMDKYLFKKLIEINRRLVSYSVVFIRKMKLRVLLLLRRLVNFKLFNFISNISSVLKPNSLKSVR